MARFRNTDREKVNRTGAGLGPLPFLGKGTTTVSRAVYETVVAEYPQARLKILSENGGQVEVEAWGFVYKRLCKLARENREVQ
jgi:hypothetical protein